MNKAFVLDREFLFKDNIFELTSISVEPNFDINGSYIEGEFIVSGDYKLHEISINKEDFGYKIPFKEKIDSNINLDTVDLEISDFNYDLNKDELKVHIEYIISGEELEGLFDSEEELNNFLSSTDAEIIDFRDDESISVVKTNEDRNDDVDQNVILNAINDEESFVTYHVHTVGLNDTIESITQKYKISTSCLKKYNTFDNLELNMKLLIPDEES